MELKNMENTVKYFNLLCENPSWNETEMRWMQHWKSYLAMSLIDDLGLDLAEEICGLVMEMAGVES